MAVHDEPSVDRDAGTDREGSTDETAHPDSSTRREASEDGFLGNVEFLTGPDPNLGSFLLVVGMVSIVFIALFQLTLPTTVAYLLTAGVLFVTVISALFAFLLDAFGYFDTPEEASKDARQQRSPDAKPWVPAASPSKPLPPLLNFDADLRAYHAMFDGDLPAAFDPFLEDYRRLKTNTRNRPSIASDLRADLNPIGTLFQPGTEGDRLYEDISARLFRYIDADRELATVDRVTFHDDDGAETGVAALAGGLGRIELVVGNEGEAVDATVVVEFRDATGAVVASRTCDAGYVAPGASRTVDVDVFVPTEAVRATTRLQSTEVQRPDAGSSRRIVEP
ncbi:hypothetical protein [Halorubellus salinus]|uniref:hypothetical protein n=1 Tax=Halorubellus salinus TaxID=755309 RepID=UPI001D096587|nr:hypothetical protein [Halorubellus salinus]